MNPPTLYPSLPKYTPKHNGSTKYKAHSSLVGRAYLCVIFNNYSKCTVTFRDMLYCNDFYSIAWYK